VHEVATSKATTKRERMRRVRTRTAREGDEGPDVTTLMAVVKPPRGVAGDAVHLCPDLPSLRRAFARVLHTTAT
jgi:hypothetical protein